jgi:hypothetical protein
MNLETSKPARVNQERRKAGNFASFVDSSLADFSLFCCFPNLHGHSG